MSKISTANAALNILAPYIYIYLLILFFFPDNRVKYFQNGTFPKRIVELLKDVPKSTGLDYECVIKVLYKLAPESTYHYQI
jgi:glycerophosphoryl diester phosphodiesterase